MLAYKRSLLRKKVIVNLKQGGSYRGIMWAKRGPLIVLKDVESLTANREPEPMGGELVAERANVAFFQVVA
jgi:hypothetical protein